MYIIDGDESKSLYQRFTKRIVIFHNLSKLAKRIGHFYSLSVFNCECNHVGKSQISGNPVSNRLEISLKVIWDWFKRLQNDNDLLQYEDLISIKRSMFLNSNKASLKWWLFLNCFKRKQIHIEAAVPAGSITSRKSESNNVKNHCVVVSALPHKVHLFYWLESTQH